MNNFIGENIPVRSNSETACSRLDAATFHQSKVKLRKLQAVLREEHGATPQSLNSILTNRICPYKTVEEESAARADGTLSMLKIIHDQLPTLLEKFKCIRDPRREKSIKHQLSSLMLYGLLSFIFQMGSRREANRKLTRPQFIATIQAAFPELESIPHHDTLNRVLAGIDVSELENAHIALIEKLIRNKKFRKYLVNNCYTIAVDGTQKFKRDEMWAEECSHRKVGPENNKRLQYYVYVLEANLVFHNGMSIPLFSEFLEYVPGEGSEQTKQDCELKAFKRLAERIKNEFRHLPIMILLDGLYPNGPLFEICKKNNWQFMVVLQDKSLPQVWNDINWRKDKDKNNSTLKHSYRGREQTFWWVNEIDYEYGPHDSKSVRVHAVVCEETWKETDKKNNAIISKQAKHVWLSSHPLNKNSVVTRCNKGARCRWHIETSNLVEKCQGYQYEHCFSTNWNAMKGYHALMRLAHALNVLAMFTKKVKRYVKDLGVRGVIEWVLESCAGNWIDLEWLRKAIKQPSQLRIT